MIEIQKILDITATKINNIIENNKFMARIFIILYVFGIILYFVWRIVVNFIAAIVWFVTAIIEICLMPVYFLVWLFIGKFPMFKMHDYILKKLNFYDKVYENNEKD